MADLRIPLRAEVPRYRQRTTLDGTEYVLGLRWSGRESKWYLELRDANDELLAGPMKAVVNFPLLETRRAGRPADEFPPGELVFVDGRAVPQDPGLEELGVVVQLIYREAA